MTVISTSSEDSKLEIAKKLGATHVINYRTHEDWTAEVLRLTDGKGVDHVVEVGSMGTIEQSIRSTNVMVKAWSSKKMHFLCKVRRHKCQHRLGAKPVP